MTALTPDQLGAAKLVSRQVLAGLLGDDDAHKATAASMAGHSSSSLRWQIISHTLTVGTRDNAEATVIPCAKFRAVRDTAPAHLVADLDRNAQEITANARTLYDLRPADYDEATIKAYYAEANRLDAARAVVVDAILDAQPVQEALL